MTGNPFSTTSSKQFHMKTIFFYTYKLIQSCLGLVCIRWYTRGTIIVCNPSTQELLTLPPRPNQKFDVCIGFGYTASTEQFKVLRFYTEDDDYFICFCEVITLGTSDGWREAKSDPPFRPTLQGYLPLLHGALHFLPCAHHHPKIEDHYIAAFDVNTEEYRVVPLPKIYFYFGKVGPSFLEDRVVLAELRGSLCLTFDFFESENMLQLWFLKDYNRGKWVRGYTIELPSSPSFWSPLTITSDDCILLNIAYLKEPTHELCCYNIHDNAITKTIGTDYLAVFYIESFFPLGSR